MSRSGATPQPARKRVSIEGPIADPGYCKRQIKGELRREIGGGGKLDTKKEKKLYSENKKKKKRVGKIRKNSQNERKTSLRMGVLKIRETHEKNAKVSKRNEEKV